MLTFITYCNTPIYYSVIKIFLKYILNYMLMLKITYDTLKYSKDNKKIFRIRYTKCSNCFYQITEDKIQQIFLYIKAHIIYSNLCKLRH